MDVDSEYTESAATTFEWTLRGLRNLFESTKGDAKAKVTKSVKFGGGRWQVCRFGTVPLLHTLSKIVHPH